MSIVFVAGVWFVLGVVVSMLSGRGIARSPTPQRGLTTVPVAPGASRRFTTLEVHEWALAADRIALDELLAPPAGVPSGKV